MAKAKDITSISVRLDPKTKYGLDLLGRHHKNSLSGVIEWFIHQTIRSKEGLSNEKYDEDLLELLYDKSESLRFLKLIEYKFNLISDEDHEIWSEIFRTNECWVEKKIVRIINKDLTQGPPRKGDDLKSEEDEGLVYEEDYGIDGRYVEKYWELIKSNSQIIDPSKKKPYPENPKRAEYKDLDLSVSDKNLRTVLY